MIESAQNPSRRAFDERAQLVAYLSPLLDEAEQRRMHEFLDECERALRGR